MQRIDGRAAMDPGPRDASGPHPASDVPHDALERERAFSQLMGNLLPAVADLFQDYEISVEQGSESGPAPIGDGKPLGAIMGYSHERLRGAVVLLASAETVRAWRIAYDGKANGDLCDTIGEFSNMLLGRFKARLLEAGLPILLATPTTAVALQLGQPPPGVMATRLDFSAGSGSFSIRLEARFENEFRWPASGSVKVAAEAGEMLLF